MRISEAPLERREFSFLEDGYEQRRLASVFQIGIWIAFMRSYLFFGGIMCSESGFRSIPTYKQDFESGRQAHIRGGKAKCPFAHETARPRRIAWFAGLNFEKGKEEGFGRSPRIWAVIRSFAGERERGFVAGLAEEKRAIPVPIRPACDGSSYSGICLIGYEFPLNLPAD